MPPYVFTRSLHKFIVQPSVDVTVLLRHMEVDINQGHGPAPGAGLEGLTTPDMPEHYGGGES